MKAELELAAAFVADHPEPAAAVLEQLSFGDAAAVLERLGPEQASQVVGRVSGSLAAECLRLFPLG